MWFLKALWNAITSTDDRKARAEEIKARAEETRIINMGYRELNEELRRHRAEDKIVIEEKQNRIKELEAMKGKVMNAKDRETLLDDETGFHYDYIELMNKYRDAMEELYFLRFEIKKLKQ